MKGKIQPDPIQVHRYKLLVLGLIPLTITEMSGIEDALETVELPDRTRVTGGERTPPTFTMMLPCHHFAEEAAMELWFKESQAPVAPGYKKTATLIIESSSGQKKRSYTITGLFPTQRKLPDLEMENEGDMAYTEWTMSADDIRPI